MDITIYRTLHLIGMILLFQALGATLFQRISGGAGSENTLKTGIKIMNGVGLVLLLVSGFGMLARLGLMGAWPVWVWGMIVIWVVLGALTWILKKYPATATLWWKLAFVLGSVAAYLGIMKPL